MEGRQPDRATHLVQREPEDVAARRHVVGRHRPDRRLGHDGLAAVGDERPQRCADPGASSQNAAGALRHRVPPLARLPGSLDRRRGAKEVLAARDRMSATAPPPRRRASPPSAPRPRELVRSAPIHGGFCGTRSAWLELGAYEFPNLKSGARPPEPRWAERRSLRDPRDSRARSRSSRPDDHGSPRRRRA